MKKMITISGIVSLFFLCSCVTLNEFPIEVFQPAKITLPAEIKNVTNVSKSSLSVWLRNIELGKEAKRILKDDGLLIIAVPNVDSFAAKVFKNSLKIELDSSLRADTSAFG